jgi:hypothetical protein
MSGMRMANNPQVVLLLGAMVVTSGAVELPRMFSDHCYQGESNASRAKQYETIFPQLILDWRRLWKKDLPSVMVSSKEVAQPVAVRYAWASNPEGANLVNGEGLPASLFRTDDWKLSTE